MDLQDCLSAEEVSAFALRAFGEFGGQLEQNRLEFEKQGIRPGGLFERMLGFQHFLSETASAPYLSGESKIGEQSAPDEDLAELSILFMLGHNMRYLLPAMRALEQDLTPAYEVLVRPVVESIPKSFYLMARPHAVRSLMAIDLYSAWRSQNPRQKYNDSVDEFFRSSRPRELLGKTMTATDFSDLHRQHSNKRIRECLYVDEILKLQTDLYAKLSSSSHANVFRPFPAPREPARSEYFENVTAALSFFNLFLLVNSQSRTLKDLGLWEPSVLFVRNAAKDLGQFYHLANLYPDKAEYTKNLAIHLGPSA